MTTCATFMNTSMQYTVHTLVTLQGCRKEIISAKATDSEDTHAEIWGLTLKVFHFIQEAKFMTNLIPRCNFVCNNKRTHSVIIILIILL